VPPTSPRSAGSRECMRATSWGPERVQERRQVEPPVERCPLLLHRLHRAHRRSAEQDLQLRARADTGPDGTEHARQLRRGLGEGRQLVEHQKERALASGSARERGQLRLRRPPAAGMEERGTIGGEMLEQSGLADSPSPPDDPEGRARPPKPSTVTRNVVAFCPAQRAMGPFSPPAKGDRPGGRGDDRLACSRGGPKCNTTPPRNLSPSASRSCAGCG
jgi:hypothetical protein